MLRMTRTLASSLAFVVAGSMVPVAANASPLGRLLHLHPGAPQIPDTRIVVHIFNAAPIFQDVKVDGHVYTMLPHHGLGIKAPAGTPVYANSTGFNHRRGDLLLTVTPAENGTTVYIN
jgi:hypothetical protein